MFRVYSAGSSGPVLLCIHGGGYSGLTWSLLAAQLKSGLRVVAPDLRGHGDTTVSGDEGDLSIDTLVADVVALWGVLWPASSPAPAAVVVGHSMGGAVAVQAARSGLAGCAGAVVIDVVEGTALASLHHMRAVLEARPQAFASVPAAIQWSLRTGMCRSAEAACVSVPGMLRPGRGAGDARGEDSLRHAAMAAIVEEGACEGAMPAEGALPSGAARSPAGPASTSGADVASVGTAAPPQAGGVARGGAAAGGRVVWRAALQRSEAYWEGWYRGLSDAFLGLPLPKALVLAGTDRLDKALTIGQMQGKFQLVLLPRAGHAVHEDEAERVAETLAQFVKRFRVGEPPLQLPRPSGPAPRKP